MAYFFRPKIIAKPIFDNFRQRNDLFTPNWLRQFNLIFVFRMAIEAFLFLMQKMKSDNTSTVLNRFQVQGQPRQPVVANRKRTLPIELDDRSVQPVAQRLVRNEIRETSPIKPVNRPKPDIVTIHTGQQPITPPVMPINAGRLPMHPGMPPANIQRHSPGQPTPMPRPPPAPVTGHPINIPRLSPGQQPIIPPLRMPIPEPTKLESSDVLELNMGEDKDTDTSQTSEPPQPWKQFVVESLEGNQPANGQGGSRFPLFIIFQLKLQNYLKLYLAFEHHQALITCSYQNKKNHILV